MSDHGEQKARALPATELAPPEPRWRERLIARLMEALRPFAAASEKWRLADVGTMLDTQRVMVDVGDLRRAQAALDHASQVAWDARAGAEPAPAPEPAPSGAWLHAVAKEEDFWEYPKLSAALKAIRAVHAWQADDQFHPLTCGNDSSHAPLLPALVDQRVVLVCRDCTYVQEHIPEVIIRHAEEWAQEEPAPPEPAPSELATALRELKKRFGPYANIYEGKPERDLLEAAAVAIEAGSSIPVRAPDGAVSLEPSQISLRCGETWPDEERERITNDLRAEQGHPEGLNGGCGKGPVKWMYLYRCVECGRFFHRQCIEKHFAIHRPIPVRAAPEGPTVDDLLALGDRMPPDVFVSVAHGDFTLRMMLRIIAGALGEWQAERANRVASAPQPERPPAQEPPK